MVSSGGSSIDFHIRPSWSVMHPSTLGSKLGSTETSRAFYTVSLRMSPPLFLWNSTYTLCGIDFLLLFPFPLRNMSVGTLYAIRTYRQLQDIPLISENYAWPSSCLQTKVSPHLRHLIPSSWHMVHVLPVWRHVTVRWSRMWTFDVNYDPCWSLPLSAWSRKISATPRAQGKIHCNLPVDLKPKDIAPEELSQGKTVRW